ncbi:MAG: sigma-70 family RNA polymerase sigma factor [Thermoleophilaceae bacterium]
MRPMAAAVGTRGKARRESPAREYELHRGAVLAMLAKRFPRIDEDERLAIYHEAWARVYAKRGRGERIESLRAYLIATAGAEALNALTRRRPPAPVGPDDPRLARLADERDAVEDEVVTRDQARIARDLIDSLDARQRDVLKLRWDLQLDVDEVRAALGLSRRQYQRLAEEGAAAVAERVRELESGDWSRRQRSLLTACLVDASRDGRARTGIASARRRKEAQRLLESDPHVAALYVEMRGAMRRAAALLPLPALLPAADASAATGGVADLADGVRGAVGDALQAAKHHAIAAYVRAADPALLSSPRPGTAVAAVAATLAVGGGAYGTYEAVSAPSPPDPVVTRAHDVAPPPVAAPVGEARSSRDGDRPRKRRPADRPADRDRTEPQPLAPDTTAAPMAEPIAPPSTTVTPAPTPGTDEFGFEN